MASDTPDTPDTPYSPSQEARDLHSKHIVQAWADERASSDSFDNNLLAFSSAALGLSVAFIKDIVPLESAEWLRNLYISWFAFGGCIIVTIASFQIAAQAQRAHTGFVNEYYLQGNEAALKKTSKWSRTLPWCSVIGSALLFMGIVFTLTFACKNITHFKEIKGWQRTTKVEK